MDEKKTMFVCTKESLLSSALMNKIKLGGGEPFPVSDAQQVEASAGQPVGAVVYYMNDDVENCAPLHRALDAFCARCAARMVCVGTDEQYGVFRRDFAPTSVLFRRPLNMEQFMGSVTGASNAAARKKRVLVVDDDASYREFVFGWLRDAYDVALANGGEQALKMLSMRTFDLVLLDYEMPGLSGPETMERISALPPAERPRVVFLTGNDEESRIRHVLALHPAGYLLKTVRKDELLAKTAEFLA